MSTNSKKYIGINALMSAMNWHEPETKRAYLEEELGLSVKTNGNWFRCAKCHRVQAPKSTVVYVPDNVRTGDPVEYIKYARQHWHEFSGWCLSCASKLVSGNK